MSEKDDSTRTSWSAEQRINAGQIASEQLGSPVFLMIHKILEARHYMAWRNLPDQHTKEASALKARVNALQEIMLEMASLRDRAIEELQKRQRENDPAFQEKQHLETQGFGLDFESK